MTAQLAPSYSPELVRELDAVTFHHVEVYAGDGGRYLNRMLRDEQELRSDYQAQNDALLAACHRAGENPPLLWRGTAIPRDLVALGSWVDAGWASCSRVRSCAEMFTSIAAANMGPLKQGVTMHLTLDPEVLVLDIAACLNHGRKGEYGQHEQEIVIAPGQLWTVTQRRASCMFVDVTPQPADQILAS